MGPPELPGGNSACAARYFSASPRLQWGRRNYPAETAGGRHQGGPPEPRFNGAAGITRRKQSKHLLLLSFNNSFNGAAGITRRKPARPLVRWYQFNAALQWGRRNYPAETDYRRKVDALAAVKASMGPPELPGGNPDRAGPDRTAPQGCFNGAAGITRRKRRSADITGLPAGAGFNGAAGITRRKPRLTAASPAPHPRRFNGAAGITRRKRDNGIERAPGGTVASMGPPELPGGNAIESLQYAEGDILLQWGRRNYPAETWCNHLGKVEQNTCFNGAAGITRRKPASNIGGGSAI